MEVPLAKAGIHRAFLRKTARRDPLEPRGELRVQLCNPPMRRFRFDGSPDSGESDGGLSDDSGSCSICFVQAAAGGGTKGSTVSVAFANGVGAGDAIIVAVALGAGGGATLSTGD